MDSKIIICEDSHDYDGFAFEEDNCQCAVCLDKVKGKYYLRYTKNKKINFNDKGTDFDKIYLADEELQLTIRELCLKYCKSKWAKIYDIHNCQDRFKETDTIADIIAKQ